MTLLNGRRQSRRFTYVGRVGGTSCRITHINRLSPVRQKCSKNVRLSTHSTPMIEVLSGERVGRFPRSPSKPAGLSRRDKASRARPPFESLSQASLGQAQLHKLLAEENIEKCSLFMNALSRLCSRVASSTCSIDLCIAS